MSTGDIVRVRPEFAHLYELVTSMLIITALPGQPKLFDDNRIEVKQVLADKDSYHLIPRENLEVVG